MEASVIVKKAVEYIGVKESPANSNNVIFNTDYYGREVHDGDRPGAKYPWCMAYVWDIFRLCGASALFYDGKKTASCTTLMNWAKKNGRFVSKDFLPGDVMFFDFDGDPESEHTGICESATATTVTAIEGNTSGNGSQSNGGMVMRKTRKLSVVLGAYRPNYSGEVYSQTQFIREVQAAIGAKVDGIAGTETLSKTVTVSKKINSKHAVVAPVQRFLNFLGFACGAADGIYGSKTHEAVVSYQKKFGCTADGEITAKQKTWKTLLGM